MDVRAENRGRPHQKVRFFAAPVMGRNFLTQGRPGVRVRNVRGKSGPKSLSLCCFFFPKEDSQTRVQEVDMAASSSTSHVKLVQKRKERASKVLDDAWHSDQSVTKKPRANSQLDQWCKRTVPSWIVLRMCQRQWSIVTFGTESHWGSNSLRTRRGQSRRRGRMPRGHSKLGPSYYVNFLKRYLGDKFGESLGGSQAPPNFWKGPRTSPEVPRRLPRKFSHCGTE